MTSNRSLRPYPPASLVTSDTGTATRIAWYNRNRLNTAIRKQTDPTDTPEVGQTTTVKVYGETAILLHTETGITGTSWDYLNTDEVIDAGAEQVRLTFECIAVRDGYESLAPTTNFDRADFVVVGSDTVTFVGDTVIT